MRKIKTSFLATIVSMANKDIDSVRSIGLQVKEFDVGTETPSFYTQSALIRMAKDRSCICLVAKVKGLLVGFILTSILAAARDAYIHTIMVLPKYRKQGIAGQLLQETLKRLKEKTDDCNHVFGDIQEENEASLNLFKRNNFQVGRKFRYIDLMLPKKLIRGSKQS